jgi:hypothetical protein
MKPLEIYGENPNMNVNFQVYRRSIRDAVKPIKLFVNGTGRLSPCRLSQNAEFPEKRGIFTTLIS